MSYKKKITLFARVTRTWEHHVQWNKEEGDGQIPDEIPHLKTIEKQNRGIDSVEQWQTGDLIVQN